MWRCCVCGFEAEIVDDENFNDHPGHPEGTDYYETEWELVQEDCR